MIRLISHFKSNQENVPGHNPIVLYLIFPYMFTLGMEGKVRENQSPKYVNCFLSLYFLTYLFPIQNATKLKVNLSKQGRKYTFSLPSFFSPCKNWRCWSLHLCIFFPQYRIFIFQNAANSLRPISRLLLGSLHLFRIMV